MIYDVVRKPGQRPSSVAMTDAEGVKIVMDANGQRVKTKDQKKFRETGDAALGYILQVRPETPEEWAKRIHAAILENVDYYFARREIPKTNDVLDDARQDLYDQAMILANCEREDRFPKNSNACVGFGECCYLNLCSTGWRPDHGTVPPGYVRLEDTHVELSNG